MDKKSYNALVNDYDTVKYSFDLLSFQELKRFREILFAPKVGKTGLPYNDNKTDEQIAQITEAQEKELSGMLDTVIEKMFDKMEEKK